MAPVTVLALASFRLGRPASTGADFAEAGLPMLGGCAVCGASVAAYNACPSRSGYLKCAAGCIDGDGYDTEAEADAALFGADQDEADTEATEGDYNHGAEHGPRGEA